MMKMSHSSFLKELDGAKPQDVSETVVINPEEFASETQPSRSQAEDEVRTISLLAR